MNWNLLWILLLLTALGYGTRPAPKVPETVPGVSLRCCSGNTPPPPHSPNSQKPAGD